LDNYEKDLIRLRKAREFLLAEHNQLYADYVKLAAQLEVKNAELTESINLVEQKQKEWNEKEQEYIDRANSVAAEQMEMAIQIKHLNRELGLYEKGKKKPPRQAKKLTETPE